MRHLLLAASARFLQHFPFFDRLKWLRKFIAAGNFRKLTLLPIHATLTLGALRPKGRCSISLPIYRRLGKMN